MSCGVTHTAVVPLDLVKCRIQVNPAKYKSIFNGFKVSVFSKLNQANSHLLIITWADFNGYANEKSYSYTLQVTIAEDGARGLAKGWAPTFIGYSMQVSRSKNKYSFPKWYPSIKNEFLFH